MTDQSVAITPVDSGSDRRTLGRLLVAFHEWMADHADAYDPAAELAEDRRSLERESGSRAWIARDGGAPAGCVLLHGATDDLAELGRLWVAPAHRGSGTGRALVRTVVEEARARGYRTLGLATPPWSEAAHSLYESMGFERTPPYPGTRLPEEHHDDAIFMRLDLAGPRRNGWTREDGR